MVQQPSRFEQRLFDLKLRKHDFNKRLDLQHFTESQEYFLAYIFYLDLNDVNSVLKHLVVALLAAQDGDFRQQIKSAHFLYELVSFFIFKIMKDLQFLDIVFFGDHYLV